MRGLTKRVSHGESGNPSATGRICLQDVDRAGVEHTSEISLVVAIFTRRDIHPGRALITYQTQAFEIIRRNWFFKPSHIRFGKLVAELERLLSRVGAISVDE